MKIKMHCIHMEENQSYRMDETFRFDDRGNGYIFKLFTIEPTSPYSSKMPKPHVILEVHTDNKDLFQLKKSYIVDIQECQTED